MTAIRRTKADFPSDEEGYAAWNAGRAEGLADDPRPRPECPYLSWPNGTFKEQCLNAAWRRGYHHGIQELVLAKYGEPLA
ncbi:hypothetical protein [Propionimicrobium sp. PCR01-08-3]|uniref:hypothetical protein n=1 Tax=Propionimicrobium sp. PCR01-08-3 TaxID=3052086 RepID=UPI00255C5C3C|nr:hypothetical protein [Propionimicrobium sp. PCR01-08-3]WIY82584.1 hypothetical protein QQ658_13940 [Propionimicrobium sp. PCR01-08-3]